MKKIFLDIFCNCIYIYIYFWIDRGIKRSRGLLRSFDKFNLFVLRLSLSFAYSCIRPLDQRDAQKSRTNHAHQPLILNSHETYLRQALSLNDRLYIYICICIYTHRVYFSRIKYRTIFYTGLPIIGFITAYKVKSMREIRVVREAAYIWITFINLGKIVPIVGEGEFLFTSHIPGQ